MDLDLVTKFARKWRLKNSRSGSRKNKASAPFGSTFWIDEKWNALAILVSCIPLYCEFNAIEAESTAIHIDPDRSLGYNDTRA